MKICVIGAGPNGLTTIKQLLDEKHDVVCFEKNTDIGGIWHRHDGDSDEMKVYDDLILTISMKLMSFSDFIAEDRVFATREGYRQYLESYAEKFALKKHIVFNTGVDDVKKLASGKWQVTTTVNGQSKQQTFDAVALCTGPFRKPNRDVKHLEAFKGEVVHSSRYRNNRAFRGKRVLVIGLAESGADILRQISDVSAECTLALRSYPFLLPRLFNGTTATDALGLRCHHYEIYVRATKRPFPLKSIFGDAAARLAFVHAAQRCGAAQASPTDFSALFNVLGGGTRAAPAELPMLPRVQFENLMEPPKNRLGQTMYPLKLDIDTPVSDEVYAFINEWNRKSHKYLGCYAPRAIACKNISFVPNILNRKIQVNDTGISDIQGNTVYFTNGEAKEVDCIVLCTGFKEDFSVLSNVTIEGNNVRNLYKHAFHPDHDGLALIGFVRPLTGGIPICAELQARYFALVCSGKHRLPEDVRQRIKDEKAWEEFFMSVTPHHFEAIPSNMLWCDSIAKEIGILPSETDLINNPELLGKLWFCSFNQLSYRLVGPHNMGESAMKEIMNESLPGDRTVIPLAFSILSMMPPNFHPTDHRFPGAFV